MSKELTKTETRQITTDSRILPPEEVAASILLLFKDSVRRAGGYNKEEYKLLYGRAEDNLKQWLSHLVTLALQE